MRKLLLLALLTGCIDVTGVPEHGSYEFKLSPPDCPVPAPVVNDVNQLPSTFPLGCPYLVRLPDGTLETRTFGGTK